MRKNYLGEVSVFKRVAMVATVLMGTGLLLTGCQKSVESPRGFSLPAGDEVKGQQAFIDYGCINCHKVSGVQASQTPAMSTLIELGGKDTRVRTYGELVTSIINPSHRLSPRYPVCLTSKGKESKMINVNDTLTVTDLVNLVAFLQPKFDVQPSRVSEYRTYKLRTPLNQQEKN
jgi:hypothetical protein